MYFLSYLKDIQLEYVNGIDKSIGQLAGYSKTLAGYVQTIITCIHKIEKAVNGTLYFNCKILDNVFCFCFNLNFDFVYSKSWSRYTKN